MVILHMEIAATERCESTPGPVVEFAHPFHKSGDGLRESLGKGFPVRYDT